MKLNYNLPVTFRRRFAVSGFLIAILGFQFGFTARAEEDAIARLRDPIQWEGDVTSAYTLGIEKDLPVVVVFVSPVPVNARFSNELRSHVFSADFQVLAGKAVFVLAEPANDEMARKVFERLEQNRYPSVSVLEPNSERIVEIGRYEGCPEVADLVRHLERWIGQYERADS